MSSARLVRSTKSRFVVYVCAVLAFGIVIYMFHGSQIQLDDNKKALSTCKLQTESLSAQLQVIFEYKLRLERSLQKEKLEHKRTKDECQNKARQDKDDRDRELVEASNKYNALIQSTNLLKSKQKDLEDETNELRKKNLKLLNDMEVQKNNHKAKLTEEQQLRSDREKDIEHAKTRNLELEVKLNRLIEENEKLKKERQPESMRVDSLEKANTQLERELDSAKSRLDLCLGGDKEAAEKKSSVGGVGENPSAVEPPKFFFLNRHGTNSTTPVINPEAVIEHDASSPKPLPKSTKTMATGGDASKKLTQAAAAPLQSPVKQQENAVGPAPALGPAPDDMELNRQIPVPNEVEPQQPPQNNVIKRPDYSERNRAEKKEELVDENQGGEVDRGIAGPMNPIQEPAANAIPGQSKLEAAKNKVLNAIQWEEEGGQNGAHEEGEEEAAPPHHPAWRMGDEAENNKVLPRHMSHDYQGLEYDKDNQEEEEDEEGEQMDYLGGERAPKHPKQMAKLRQFERNAEPGGGGVMLNPK